MVFVFFFNDTATTEIYTLSLHDALPIFVDRRRADEAGGELRGDVEDDQRDQDPARRLGGEVGDEEELLAPVAGRQDRKSTRLNSSHANISYAAFCLKKKKKKTSHTHVAP